MLQSNGTAAYDLLPNPNSGNFIVRQSVADDKPVQAEVWNAIGARVYKSSLQFKGKKAEMKLNNVSAGNYLLKLNDSKGKRYTIKFTILQ